jgi:transcriptional regulator with GAF, ATPase, and Fis domain
VSSREPPKNLKGLGIAALSGRGLAARKTRKKKKRRTYSTKGAERMSGMDKGSILPPSENQSLPGASRNTNSNGVPQTKKIIYKAEVMKQLMRMVDRVAPSNATVLILGESGTGKELVANAIHERSSRSHKPFVAINCGALRETLLESELFGHEKGAFTGAYSRKIGLAEVANGGTLFLDEIGELSPGIQSKLLRFLQEGEIYRVGGKDPIKVDIRLISATNKEL